MTNIINLGDHDPVGRRLIESEAQDWITQLDKGRPSREELNEFQEWLNRSPYHKDAFKVAAAAWIGMDRLSVLLDMSSGANTVGKAYRPIARTWFRLLQPGYAVAGLILAIVVIIAFTAYPNISGNFQENGFDADYITSIGEVRSITLPDGSRVSMNTKSKINVTYAHDVRLIRLSEGEAWFDVYHDTEKPFIVYAGHFAVWAVGTAFSVNLMNNNVNLTVTEGRIEVASLQDGVFPETRPDWKVIKQAAFRIPLVQGQHMILDNNLGNSNDAIELVRQIEPEQIEKNLSWRDGMLIFDNDTLKEVVAEINRYTSMKIIISESEIQDMRFGGYFKAGDITSILASLEEGFGIRVEKINQDLVYLSQQREQK